MNEKLILTIATHIFNNNFNSFRDVIVKYLPILTDVDKEIIVSLLVDNNKITMLKYVFYMYNFNINENHGWHSYVSNYIKIYEWMLSEFGETFKRKVIRLDIDFNRSLKI
jgi:hypothetical protein